MKRLMFSFLILLPITLYAQTPPVPVTPTDLQILVIPNTGDPNIVPAVWSTPMTNISKVSTNCNLVPSPNAVNINPGVGEVTDPFNVGRVCRLPLDLTTLPDGTYRTVAIFSAPTCNPTGKQEIKPCPSVRSALGMPNPFLKVTPSLAPSAPMGLLLSQ